VAATTKLNAADVDALVHARHPEPRSVLGYHEYERAGDTPVCIVRVLEPDADQVQVHWEGDVGQGFVLDRLHPAGLFEGRVPHRRPLQPYTLRIRYRNGAEAIKHDAYYFAPQLSDLDLYLFGEGNHHSLYYKLGAHPSVVDGLAGTLLCRVGSRMPNASASSGRSTSGTAASMQCRPAPRPASGSCSYQT
jgi:1,4-alpha-glucan branching enzyme